MKNTKFTMVVRKCKLCGYQTMKEAKMTAHQIVQHVDYEKTGETRPISERYPKEAGN